MNDDQPNPDEAPGLHDVVLHFRWEERTAELAAKDLKAVLWDRDVGGGPDDDRVVLMFGHKARTYMQELDAVRERTSRYARDLFTIGEAVVGLEVLADAVAPCSQVVGAIDALKVRANQAEERIRALEGELADWRGTARLWKGDHDAQKARADATNKKLEELLVAADALLATAETEGSAKEHAWEWEQLRAKALAARGEP